MGGCFKVKEEIKKNSTQSKQAWWRQAENNKVHFD